MIDKTLLEQLSIAFGDEKAKELVLEVQEIKNKNPGTSYSFIFSEDGKVTAIKKNNTKENLNNEG